MQRHNRQSARHALVAGLGALGLALAAVPALAQEAGAPAGPQHPLDALTAAEYGTVVETLEAAGRLPEGARFPIIELVEPPKQAVLDWQAGEPIPRTARAVVKRGRDSWEAVIDLQDGELVSYAPTEGESMVLFEEFIGAMELALGHPDMVAGLEKRGLSPDEVFCLPLTAGDFGTPEEEGKRLMKVPCYVNPTASNFYAKPIEGLFATVDLNEKEVVSVTDQAVLPLPEDPWGYTDAEIDARYGLRPEAEPVELVQPEGSNVTLEGNRVEWDMWRFHLRTDKRPGLVVSLIEAFDGDDWRSVLYQAHLSEVFVPYMDPDEGWYWRTYMDSGEYGFGLFLSPLRPEVDCPDYAIYRPAMVHTDTGEPLEIPDAVCIFERDTGDAAWRHFEIFAQSEERFVPTEGRPWRELVVRTASEVGNYDYFIDYVFQRDGTMRIAVGSTGLDAVKGVAATSMEDETAAAETEWGTLIAPHLVAPNHDHFFNFRLDFDVDGRDNNFMRVGIVPAETPEGARRTSMWTTETFVPRTEDEASFRVNPENPALYHVGNPNVKSGLGHRPTYMVMPGDAVAYSPLDVADDPPAVRNAYIDKTFWVTPHDPSQRYAGGEYAFQSDGSDTLARWVEEGRSIDNTDIVVWTTMGFHHVPRMEDWPVMPTMWKTITLKPFNFFDHNPAITVRSPETE
jgi:primary-amine oxidase